MTYLESSALLSWLLQEPRGEEVRRWIDDSEMIAASELTLLEVSRTLARLRSGGSPPRTVDALHAQLERLKQAWWVVVMTPSIVQRAGEPFSVEPVRSLDAIHLATAQAIAQSSADERVVILSLDRRVRINGIAAGFDVAPTPTDEEREAAGGDHNAGTLARRRTRR